MIKKVWLNVQILALIANIALTTLDSIADNYDKACFHLLLAIMIMVSMVISTDVDKYK